MYINKVSKYWQSDSLMRDLAQFSIITPNWTQTKQSERSSTYTECNFGDKIPSCLTPH